MASSKEYLHFILEQLSALECMPTAVCDFPYEGAKEMLLVEEVDNKEFLTKLFEAMYKELPSPKPRRRKEA